MTTGAPLLAVLLVKITEDPDVDDAPVAKEEAIPELDEVEDENPVALLAELAGAKVADEELIGGFIAPAIWPACEFSMAWSRPDGIQVVS